jgi:hypothetical protein
MEGALDAQGKTVAWLHRTVFPSIASTFTPNVSMVRRTGAGQGVTDIPYDNANIGCETMARRLTGPRSNGTLRGNDSAAPDVQDGRRASCRRGTYAASPCIEAS